MTSVPLYHRRNAAADSTAAIRVVQRYVLERRAGILQAPPAMLEEIMAWIEDVLNATRSHKARRDLELQEAHLAFLHEWSAMALRDTKAFVKAPTWKGYQALLDQISAHGRPSEQLRAKDFQKKQAPLLPAHLSRLLTDLEAIIQAAQDGYLQRIAELKASIQVVPADVKPLGEGESVKRTFPVNLEGWRYDSARLRKLVEERVKKDGGQMLEWYEKAKAMGMEQRMLDSMLQVANKGTFGDIMVSLTTVHLDRYLAYWQPAAHLIEISFPTVIRSDALAKLRQSLTHELKHMGQSYLSYVIGHAAGLPARRLLTPEFKQEYDPGLVHGDQEKATAARQWVTDKGIDPRKLDWHALDDVEFYTVLEDSINEFRDRYAQYSGIDLNEAVKSWTGAGMSNPVFPPHRLFKALRKYAPGKWRKAVSEFVKAVL